MALSLHPNTLDSFEIWDSNSVVGRLAQIGAQSEWVSCKWLAESMGTEMKCSLEGLSAKSTNVWLFETLDICSSSFKINSLKKQKVAWLLISLSWKQLLL